jgi:hypothetical protein
MNAEATPIPPFFEYAKKKKSPTPSPHLDLTNKQSNKQTNNEICFLPGWSWTIKQEQLFYKHLPQAILPRKTTQRKTNF